MKITVTQHHIDKGEPSSCHWCPIALAIRSILGAGVKVRSGFVRFPKLYRNQRRNLPESARQFIMAFDAKGRNPDLDAIRIQPFTFEINDLRP